MQVERTNAPLADSWVAHPFRREGGAASALDTLYHTDGGREMTFSGDLRDSPFLFRKSSPRRRRGSPTEETSREIQQETPRGVVSRVRSGRF